MELDKLKTETRPTRIETKISSVAFTFGNRAIFGRKAEAESERERNERRKYVTR